MVDRDWEQWESTVDWSEEESKLVLTEEVLVVVAEVSSDFAPDFSSISSSKLTDYSSEVSTNPLILIEVTAVIDPNDVLQTRSMVKVSRPSTMYWYS